MATELQRQGLNVGRIQDSLRGDLVKNVPIIGKGLAWYNHKLFSEMTRGLMSRAAIGEFERIQKANPEMDGREIMRTVARDCNNFFGSIGRQGWVKSRTFSDVMNMSLLAPQWFEGLVKKDAAIPYKLMTGQGMKLLRGQETTGRAILRGLGTMIVLTQVINLINKRKPTWENDDKEHRFDADLGDGLYLSPLSVFNEISHDLWRYGQAKPKVWDAVQQIGENKLSFLSRAALVLATDRSPTGEYQTTTAGVLGTAAKQLIPTPISLKSPVALAGSVMQGQPPNAQQIRSLAGLAGLKMDVQRSAVARASSMAESYVKAAGLKDEPVIITPTEESSYSKLRQAIESGDMKNATALYQQLLKHGNPAKIYKDMFQWRNRPLTGSHKAENMWLSSMDDNERAVYQQAILYKADLFSKWQAFYQNQQ